MTSPEDQHARRRDCAHTKAIEQTVAADAGFYVEICADCGMVTGGGRTMKPSEQS